MSCGEHHETNCSEVLSEVWLFLDQECDQARRELLATHLDECHPCLEEYGLEEHLKALLARKCGGDLAPDELKARLRARIRETVTVRETTVRETTASREGADGVVTEVRRVDVEVTTATTTAPSSPRASSD
ncbi:MULTISPECIES: mycothiol system anti-sigma-R factor [Actinosynnema]|uniref:mycothiol system anti-sigma-R factor n=1 Tax=Actinosynnema TaxID=40566 RepID=UPI0020A455C3|nr:mycothiol system anti-sigma-R factor [Actinosynnema pretiosum]MCP2097906.1 mycothiol system anti-sigma-R factor [Actinosynnema pretiosum]